MREVNLMFTGSSQGWLSPIVYGNVHGESLSRIGQESKIANIASG
jgi:hypothetical protein